MKNQREIDLLLDYSNEGKDAIVIEGSILSYNHVPDITIYDGCNVDKEKVKSFLNNLSEKYKVNIESEDTASCAVETIEKEILSSTENVRIASLVLYLLVEKTKK